MKKLTQADVDSIVRRAKELGAGDGLTHKSGQFDPRIYNTGSPEGDLAMLVINAWDGKYDLIYGMQAALEHVSSNTLPDSGRR